MVAGRGERVDGTFEAVEDVRLVVGHAHSKGFVVFVATDLTLSHLHPLQ
jgi:hypothetical protein